MIEIVDVFFQYNNSNEVIRDLSLVIPKGSCTAIIGNSGCGKSTLLNLVAGILKPDRGQIIVHTNHYAYLMQDVTLLPYKTTLENVLLAHTLRTGRVDENTKQRAVELLTLFKIEKDTFKKYPHELSGGMKQRIGLVQTLLTDPELLLLDEPFNAVDVNALETIETYVWDFVKKRECTMVFITHNIDQALLLSDRIIILGNNYTIHQVKPTCDFISFSPSQRTNNAEYKTLFLETIEKMRL